jgi:hypothetical protein
MSVLEELSGLEKKVADRMRELRPLLDEYSQLEKVAERLGITADLTSAQSATDAATGRKTQGGDRSVGARDSSRSTARETPAGASDASADDAQSAPVGASTDDTASVPRGRSRDEAPSTPTRRRRGKSSAKPGSGEVSRPKTRQPGGSRSKNRTEQVATLVAERPGITVKDIGAELGADPTSLYRVIRRLESDGRLKKDGKGLLPA